MKIAKLIVGIVSIVLSILVLFQSCAAGVGDALAAQGGTSGGSGMIVAVILLVAGIVAIATRNSRGGAFFCAAAYAVGGVVALTANGVFQDLLVWGVISLVFALIFLYSALTMKPNKEEPAPRHGK